MLQPVILIDAEIISPSYSAEQLYIPLWYRFSCGITRVPLENTLTLLAVPMPSRALDQLICGSTVGKSAATLAVQLMSNFLDRTAVELTKGGGRCTNRNYDIT